MPEGFAFPDRSIDVWRPLGMRPETAGHCAPSTSSTSSAESSRLSRSSRRGPISKASRIAAQKKYPETNDQRGTTMVPLQEAVVGDVRQPLYLLGGRRRPAAAHRVRQRREPDAGPERRQAARAGGQERPRRGPAIVSCGSCWSKVLVLALDWRRRRRRAGPWLRDCSLELPSITCRA